MKIIFIATKEQKRVDKAYAKLVRQFVQDYVEEGRNNEGRAIHKGVNRGTKREGLLSTRAD